MAHAQKRKHEEEQVQQLHAVLGKSRAVAVELLKRCSSVEAALEAYFAGG